MSRVERAAATPPPTLSGQLGLSETVIELGMIHPGVRRTLAAAGSTLGFVVSLDDECITDLEVEIGLGHRGFEKEVESSGWIRALPYVRRLGLAGGVFAELAFCSAIEELADLELPDRAVWLRMLVSELARAADHFARLASVASAIELPDAEATAQRGELQLAALLEGATGAGALVRWARPGGVEQGLSDRFHEIWPDARKAVEATIGRFETVGARNPSCMLRLRDTARLSSEDCLAWSVTGPALRAAGMPMDLRRDAPYLAYGSVDFTVPVGARGDDYDRLIVVVEEIRQSIRIAGQCVARLADLGPGPLGVDDCGWSEVDLRDEEVDGPVLPPGEVSISVEASTGELGFLLVSDGQRLPRRIRCRAPSFFHAQAMPVILRGARLDDLLPTAALMHLVSGECDR